MSDRVYDIDENVVVETDNTILCGTVVGWQFANGSMNFYWIELEEEEVLEVEPKQILCLVKELH